MKGRTLTTCSGGDNRDEVGAELKTEKLELTLENSRGTTTRRCLVHQTSLTFTEQTEPIPSDLMSQIVSRTNMQLAYKRVLHNKGAAGIDGMTVDQLKQYCQEHWLDIRPKLLDGSYRPQAIRRVDIPKPGGGTRMLGIPTVLDRLIQQAILQILQPLLDPTFSEHSYGFRPGRSAHQALFKAQSYIREGYRWVVDMDLEKFFDKVNHDILMDRLYKRVQDQPLLRIIRRYLSSGMVIGGINIQRQTGMPQGGPLSPLLSNLLLDELDKELSERGHRYVRYADDCNIYVKSERAGQRVLASITRFVETRLKLTVNSKKSAVSRPWKRTFLGYSFTVHMASKLRVPKESVKRLKEKLRKVYRNGRGQRIEATTKELEPILRGWVEYFKHSEIKRAFEDLDGWVRRKMRCIYWRHWKTPKTRAYKLKAFGLTPERASCSSHNGRGPWWNSGASHMHAAITTKHLRMKGLLSLIELYRGN